MSEPLKPCPHPDRYDRGECCGGLCAPDDEAAALATWSEADRQTFHRVMGQRAVVKRIAEKQIREGE